MMEHSGKCTICGGRSDSDEAAHIFDAPEPEDRLCPTCRKAVRDAREQREYLARLHGMELEEIDDLIQQQKNIDEDARVMAKEIVDGQDPKTLEDAKQFAQNWIETAAQYARNAEYWEKRARDAEKILVMIGWQNVKAGKLDALLKRVAKGD